MRLRGFVRSLGEVAQLDRGRVRDGCRQRTSWFAAPAGCSDGLSLMNWRAIVDDCVVVTVLPGRRGAQL